nr:MAG TPA: GENERAL CONTROL PROTEIN GCN4, NUCLEUS, DNA-BINDING, PROTEIN EXPORT.08A [Caudoviricetes sp.]
MNQVESKIKELIKLVGQLEKLIIRIISLVGWILILIKLFR